MLTRHAISRQVFSGPVLSSPALFRPLLPRKARVRTGATGVLSAVGLMSALLVGCSSGESAGEPVVDSNADAKRQLLASLATGVVLPSLEDFVSKAEALEAAVLAWQASGAPVDREAAQAAFTAAMTIWQELEIMQFGPAGTIGEVAGGLGRRDEIYSWPVDNPCRVDQESAASTWNDDAAFSALAVNTRGLDALEYLLFVATDENACRANSPLNTSGEWAALSADDIRTRRAGMAVAVAKRLAVDARALHNDWAPDGSNFAGQLAEAGTTSMTYATAQAAMNAVSDAMFYLDQDTKDMKVAVPVGLSGCASERCPDDVESAYSGRSKANVLANLRGFQKLFLGAAPGTDATGFDDLLNAIGAGSLATELTAAIAGAITAVDAIEGELAEAVVERPAQVEAAYEALVTLTTLLKTQLLSVLDLEIPDRAASDND